MPIAFYLLPAGAFQGEIVPAMADCWRQRSFAPSLSLCERYGRRSDSASSRLLQESDHFLLERVTAALPFDRAIWSHLVAELLILASEDMPAFQTSPEGLLWLAAGHGPVASPVDRESRHALEKIHFGSRELLFGPKAYLPDRVGWNDRDDVTDLAAYLRTLQPERWTVADLDPGLASESPEDKEDEVAFLSDCFQSLRLMIETAERRECIIVCENDD